MKKMLKARSTCWVVLFAHFSHDSTDSLKHNSHICIQMFYSTSSRDWMRSYKHLTWAHLRTLQWSWVTRCNGKRRIGRWRIKQRGRKKTTGVGAKQVRHDDFSPGPVVLPALLCTHHFQTGFFHRGWLDSFLKQYHTRTIFTSRSKITDGNQLSLYHTEPSSKIRENKF